jgi:ATP phosphoribosyltransferase regulatory subunit
MGRAEILVQAQNALRGAPAGVAQALDALTDLAARVTRHRADLDLRFDLAELAGYGYHNGPVFTAYQPARQGRRAPGSAVARGGRYDGIGAVFGRARPATGFDVNLKQLLDGAQGDEPAVWVPWPERGADSPEQSVEMSARIRALRAGGEVVVVAVAPDEDPPPRCDRFLALIDGIWSVRPLAQASEH